MKVIVIGLDGASWELIELLSDKGMLPNLKGIIDEGCHGTLESTLPPITGPAWISFATGKNPGKHGCFDFVLPSGSLTNLRPVSTKDIKSDTFYEILENNKKECICINMPGSYPPRIEGVVVTSLLTQGANFIFPPTLINEVPEFGDYRIVPDSQIKHEGKIEAYVEDIAELEEVRFNCAKRLFLDRKWDFFFLLFSGTDWIQHRMYGQLMSPGSSPKQKGMEFYHKLDEYIGWFRKNSPPGTDIILMSDHGFKAYRKVFSISEWLRKEGYLCTRSKPTDGIPRQRARAEMLKLMSQKKMIRLPSFLANYRTQLRKLGPVYRFLQRILPIHFTADVRWIDVPNSIAYATATQTNVCSIYINDKARFHDGVVDRSDYENIRNEIIDKLVAIADPDTGQPFINRIWRSEEVYRGNEMNLSPDILFTTRDYLVTQGFESSTFISESRNNHDINGIFISCGPDIAKSTEIENAGIYDLAPTILHMFGLPVPNDMDGKVLTEIFKPDSNLRLRQVMYTSGITEVEKIKEKLRVIKKKA